jgi:hypothetical protein
MVFENIIEILGSEDFRIKYDKYIISPSVKKEMKSLEDFLDNIETNKKYYRTGVQKNRRYKKTVTEDTESIKKINSDINKLSEMNYDSLKPQIISQIKVDYIIPYVIENIFDKSILHHKYIPLYVGIIKEITHESKYKLIIKLCNSYHSKFFDMKTIKDDDTFYEKLCAENKNIDNIIGFSLLITHLEKDNIINGYVDKFLEPLMDTALNNENDNDVFKMVTSFYNISTLYFKEDIPSKYVEILSKLKQKTKSSKVKFKIMDILNE